MAIYNVSELEEMVYDGVVRLEITGGVPTWESYPSLLHQETIDLIRASIEPVSTSSSAGADAGSECGCYHFSDIQIHFKDGSRKRPDIAIFCTKPPRQAATVTVTPQAVIEIISPGYEYKDLQLNPQFYLAQDIGDVVIVDPRTSVVLHYRTTQPVATHYAPVTLDFVCGCRCKIPKMT